MYKLRLLALALGAMTVTARKQLTILAFALISPLASAQTHFVDQGALAIQRVGSGGKESIPIGKPTFFLRFTASPTGKLMYVENLDTTAHASLHRLYRFFQGQARASYLRRNGDGYDPERWTTSLHVTDSKGKDLYVVPIADKHGDYWANGSFLSERLVLFDGRARNDSRVQITIVDLVGKQTWTWYSDTADDFSVDQVMASPDGANFVVTFDDKAKRERLLYFNGNLILPYFNAQPPMPTDAPEVFAQRQMDLRARLDTDYTGRFDLAVHKDTMWSESSQYLTLMLAPHPATGGLSSPDAWVLIMDTRKAGAGMDFSDYSNGVPVRLPAALKEELVRKASALEGTSSDWLLRLDPRLKPNENSIILTDDEYTTPAVKLEVPLPPDWRDRTIRDSGGIIN